MFDADQSQPLKPPNLRVTPASLSTKTFLNGNVVETLFETFLKALYERFRKVAEPFLKGSPDAGRILLQYVHAHVTKKLSHLKLKRVIT